MGCVGKLVGTRDAKAMPDLIKCVPEEQKGALNNNDGGERDVWAAAEMVMRRVSTGHSDMRPSQTAPPHRLRTKPFTRNAKKVWMLEDGRKSVHISCGAAASQRVHT
jgi:hypothetical protein